MSHGFSTEFYNANKDFYEYKFSRACGVRDQPVHVAFGRWCGPLSEIHVTVYVTPEALNALTNFQVSCHRLMLCDLPLKLRSCITCETSCLLRIYLFDLKDPILRLAALVAPDLSDFISVMIPSWESDHV